MRRRELMLLLGGAMTPARILRAQQKVMPVVGVLGLGSPGPFAPFVAALHQGLSETGHVEGQNVAFEYRWAEGRYDELPALAADLVGRNVDVIAASGGSPSARAAKGATSTIPIVFIGVRDPVGNGLVTSLARPGGNLTGFTNFGSELTPKRLELLSELVPQARVIALLVNPNNSAERIIGEMQEVARAKGVQLHILKAGKESEIDTAFATLVELRAGGVVVGSDPFFNSWREQLVALASRHAVPAIYEWREFAAAGGLISYGTSLTGVLAPGRHLRRKGPQGRQACRSAGPGTSHIRAGDQSQDRRSARPHRPAIHPRPRRRSHRMRRRSLLRRLQPCCETVERDAQSRSDLGERGEAAGLAPRFDLGQVARRDPGGGGERLAGEAAMGAPNADRMLAGAEAPHQLDRQIVCVSLLFAECCLARLGGGDCGEVLGLLEALDQRLVLGARERNGFTRVAQRYASLRCATVSRTIVSAARSTRQISRQSPWRWRITSGCPRSGVAAGCAANGAAAKASALTSKASRSRLGIPARAFDAARETISFMSPSSLLAMGPSTTIVSESDKQRDLLSQIPQSILVRAYEVIL